MIILSLIISVNMGDHKVTGGRGVDKYPLGDTSQKNSNLYEELKPVPIVDVYDGALFAAILIGVYKLGKFLIRRRKKS